jgi:hypothetical protein
MVCVKVGGLSSSFIAPRRRFRGSGVKSPAKPSIPRWKGANRLGRAHLATGLAPPPDRLWRVGPGRPLGRAFAGDLAHFDPEVGYLVSFVVLRLPESAFLL